MRLLRSFSHRNFKLYFVGQALSLLGAWMQGTANSWLIWRLTHSSAWLGTLGFASQVPILIFGLLAGVVADRVFRHRLVIGVQIAAMLQATILAIFTISGLVSPIIVLILSIFMGFVFAFDYPSRQSFLMDMVGREDISNAVALNSSIVHGARVIGPIAAGFIVAAWGEGACFVINAVSYLFVIAALLMMKRDELFTQDIAAKNAWHVSIVESLRIVWGTKAIRRPMIVMAILSLSTMPYVFLLPQVVGDTFHGGARELGIAMSFAGAGALFGAGYLAMRHSTDGLERIISISAAIAGAGLVGFAFSRNVFISLPLLTVIGLTGFLVVAGTNTIAQTNAPPQFQGRIMSLFSVIFFGLTPVGSLISGYLASIFGVNAALAFGGAVCLVFIVWLAVADSRRKQRLNGELCL